jgi:CheY-like chemotaxis protein
MSPSAATAEATVLVVDDDALLRMYAAGILEKEGYDVIEAANADEALKMLQTTPNIRLLFTDIQMPGAYDGMELARQVHARWPDIRLVIASRRVKPTRAEIPDDGRFIAKPYSEGDLMGQVDDLMQNPIK